MEGGEGVGGGFGSGGGECAEEGGLAGVWVSDESDIGDGLEFEFEVEDLSVLTWLAGFGSAVDAGDEVGVTESAASALGDDGLLSVLLEVDHEVSVFGVEDECADGDDDDGGGAVFAVHFSSASVAAVAGLPDGLEAERDEALLAAVGAEDDVAAASAVAAVGAAHGDIFLAAHAGAAAAAVAGLDVNFSSVCKHSGVLFLGKGRVVRRRRNGGALPCVPRVWPRGV